MYWLLVALAGLAIFFSISEKSEFLKLICLELRFTHLLIKFRLVGLHIVLSYLAKLEEFNALLNTSAEKLEIDGRKSSLPVVKAAGQNHHRQLKNRAMFFYLCTIR